MLLFAFGKWYLYHEKLGQPLTAQINVNISADYVNVKANCVNIQWSLDRNVSAKWLPRQILDFTFCLGNAATIIFPMGLVKCSYNFANSL